LRDGLPALDPLKLSDKHAGAVAALLPVLMCGEESAILTFEALSVTHSAAALALIGIAREEQAHELLLRRLKSALPDASDPILRRAARRFFLQIAARDTGLHCARVAALDSAVCILLGALRARGSPLAKESTMSSILTRIHRDEARHVRVTAQIATAMTTTPQARRAAFDAREELLALLSLRFDALECLGVDPDRLSRQLRDLPRALFG